MNKLHLIATGDGNWDYYLSQPYEDGSQAVLYIAKPDSGAGSGIYCGVDRLRRHFHRLANLLHGADWESLIPEDWHIVDKDFFTRNGIY